MGPNMLMINIHPLTSWWSCDYTRKSQVCSLCGFRLASLNSPQRCLWGLLGALVAPVRLVQAVTCRCSSTAGRGRTGRRPKQTSVEKWMESFCIIYYVSTAPESLICQVHLHLMLSALLSTHVPDVDAGNWPMICSRFLSGLMLSSYF